MARHIVARTTDIPPGGNKVVGIDGRDIVVFHVNGEFFALLNRCPHEGAPLEKAACVARLTSPEPGVYQRSRVGELLRCPWHGWEFDMRNGQSWFDPKRVKVRSYPVAVEKRRGTCRRTGQRALCGRDLSGAHRGQLRHRRDVSGIAASPIEEARQTKVSPFRASELQRARKLSCACYKLRWQFRTGADGCRSRRCAKRPSG